VICTGHISSDVGPMCTKRGDDEKLCLRGHESSEDSVAPETGGVPTDKGRVEAIRMLRIASGKVSCKGTATEASKLMQCEYQLYDRE
jgi:hypothetical protein